MKLHYDVTEHDVDVHDSCEEVICEELKKTVLNMFFLPDTITTYNYDAINKTGQLLNKTLHKAVKSYIQENY